MTDTDTDTDAPDEDTTMTDTDTTPTRRSVLKALAAGGAAASLTGTAVAHADVDGTNTDGESGLSFTPYTKPPEEVREALVASFEDTFTTLRMDVFRPDTPDTGNTPGRIPGNSAGRAFIHGTMEVIVDQYAVPEHAPDTPTGWRVLDDIDIRTDLGGTRDFHVTVEATHVPEDEDIVFDAHIAV